MKFLSPNRPWVLRAFEIFLLVVLASSLIGCNPEEAIQQYFADKGLNPLAILRTDIQPGTLILVDKDGSAHRAGQLTDYLAEKDRTSTTLPIDNCGSPQHCQGILNGYTEERSMTASIALSFFQSLFQVNPKIDLGMTGKVRIDQLDSSFEKIKIADLKRFLGRRTSKPVVQEILTAIADGEKAYVAYEVHRAKRLTISSAEGKNIAPSLEAKAVGTIPVGGKVGLTYKKKSEQILVVESQQPYAFAVKTGELLPFPKKNQIGVRFRVTRSIAAGEVKAAGTDDDYAAPLQGGFGAITLGNTPDQS